MHPTFDEALVLKELRHYLPTQSPLKDFIHHNSLHAFQKYKFFDGIRHARTIFGFQVSLTLEEYRALFSQKRIHQEVLERVIVSRYGEENLALWLGKVIAGLYDTEVTPRIGRLRNQWKTQYGLDMDTRVQPLLFRIASNFLDQGIALTPFPDANQGFLQAIRHLETTSFVSLFSGKKARRLLLDSDCNLSDLLEQVVGKEEYYEQYLFDQQFSHRGWSGMVCSAESNPASFFAKKNITLRDFIALELLLEIDTANQMLGKWQPLAERLTDPPLDLFAETSVEELDEVMRVWQDAFEWSYYDEVLNGFAADAQRYKVEAIGRKSFQAVFCIDERECSIRRHIESQDPAAETFGFPGFFGVEFFFLPEHAKFREKLCPAPVTPKYLIPETKTQPHNREEVMFSGHPQKLLSGLASTFTLGFYSIWKTVENLFAPRMSPAIADAFSHMDCHSMLGVEHVASSEFIDGLQLGFTVTEMANRVEGLLRGIGLLKEFAPLVYLVAHGSSSANNPHHGAHDCGACSGRPGAVNARVFAAMANHPGVRDELHKRGIDIPKDTHFIGSMHDTASDVIQYYDSEKLAPDLSVKHTANVKVFESALDLNAKERSRRFASIRSTQPIGKIRQAIHDRSVSYFEPRPELGHGTNAMCVVGRRSITKGLFLDRRSFLNSYDYRTDPEGKVLLNVMRPIGLVCGGINLEYYFSRVDNHKLGAGTKVPHHVMGLIGVTNSTDGDLRPGLPVQMIEVHDPVRLLVIVEHSPEIVHQVVQNTPEMYEWYKNEWVHLIALDPTTKRFYRLESGRMQPYEPVPMPISTLTDQEKHFQTTYKMESNRTVDATRENLAIHLIQ